MRLVVLFFDPRRNQSQLGVRLLLSHSLLQTRNEIGAMQEPATELCFARLIRQPKIVWPEGKLKRRWQDADHGEALTVNIQRLANDSRVSAKSSLPQPISKHRHLWSTGFVFARLKSASQQWFDSEHRE